MRGYPRRHTLETLLLATLITSSVHFIDNAFRLDLYPGPSWLTRPGILLAWFGLPLRALVAYFSGSRVVLVGYGLLGFAGLAHYFYPHQHGVPLRCLATIGAEAMASAALIVYVFWLRKKKMQFVP